MIPPYRMLSGREGEREAGLHNREKCREILLSVGSCWQLFWFLVLKLLCKVSFDSWGCCLLMQEGS